MESAVLLLLLLQQLLLVSVPSSSTSPVAFHVARLLIIVTALQIIPVIRFLQKQQRGRRRQRWGGLRRVSEGLALALVRKARLLGKIAGAALKKSLLRLRMGTGCGPKVLL